jgi:hypothetical protein
MGLSGMAANVCHCWGVDVLDDPEPDDDSADDTEV